MPLFFLIIFCCWCFQNDRVVGIYMTIGSQIELLRTGDLVLHCVQVEVFQQMDNGLKMSGHGTIKINSVGTIYMEFICTTSERVPDAFFNEQLPKDPLNDEQILYLRAQTIDGCIYLSDGFSIQINFNSSCPPAHYYIFLSSILSYSTTEQHESADNGYLYFEFSENFNIPANKSNSVVSSLGSESHSWNQTVLDMEGYSISMVKKSGYTEVRITGSFEPEVLLLCLKFYIGFSSASMPQFVYVLKRMGTSQQETISSINKAQTRQRASSPMVANVAGENYRNSLYHYKLLEGIIALYKNNPKHFESIYSQWERVWFSFQSKNSIMMLTLSVAIEGLLNDIYIPAFKLNDKNTGLNCEIEKVKQQINTLHLTEDQRSRLLSSVSYWENITAAKALGKLIEKGVIANSDKKLWQELRNASAHPKVKETNLANERLEHEKVSSCLNLFHKLVLNTLTFSGPIIVLQAGKEPACIKLIHTEVLKKYN